jgi:hypothetical protein
MTLHLKLKYFKFYISCFVFCLLMYILSNSIPFQVTATKNEQKYQYFEKDIQTTRDNYFLYSLQKI